MPADDTPVADAHSKPTASATVAAIDEALAEIDKKQVRLNAKRQSLVKKREKEKAALKYKLGGLAMMVGAHEMGDATFAGALWSVVKVVNDPEKGPATMRMWNKYGARLLEDAERRRQEKRDQARRDNPPLFIWVTFPEAPPDALRSSLKGHGLSWKEERKCWEGNVPKKSLPSLFRKVDANGGRLSVSNEFRAEVQLLIDRA